MSKEFQIQWIILQNTFYTQPNIDSGIRKSYHNCRNNLFIDGILISYFVFNLVLQGAWEYPGSQHQLFNN